jgi:soluble lytic murein transglycosylase
MMTRGALAALFCLLSARLASAAPTPLPDPWFSGPAAEAYALEQWQPARDGFAAMLAKEKEPGRRARLEYLISRCDARLGRWADAAQGFDRAAEALPLLADYARYDAARAYFFARSLDEAEARAKAVSTDAVLAQEAQLIIGDVLRSRGDVKGTAAHYEAYLATGKIRLAEARFRLAEAYAAEGRTADAVKLWRQVTIESPLESWATQAADRLAKLKLTKKERKALATLSAPELVTRGKVYFDAMRNEPSEADFAAALKAKGLTPALACTAAFHRAESVFKQRQRARSAPLFDDAVAACRAAKNMDLAVRSAYQGGRGWSSGSDYPKSIERFELAEKLDPAHSYADDARLRQAESWAAQEPAPGTTDKVDALLASIPTTYPNGDMKGEALWRLAWRAYRAADYAKALGFLEETVRLIPHDDNYFAEGQALYWQGRTLEKLGRPADALVAWEKTIREYPLSYYSLLAFNRLRESAPQKFAALVKELQTPPTGWKATAPMLPDRPELATPGFQRGVELLRLGLGAEAERELAKAGLRVAAGKSISQDASQRELLWASALLYDRARRYDKSHWILRWSLGDHRRRWPVGPDRLAWDVAYPRAWWHLLDPSAQAQGYPTELLISFVREESAFDPLMESYANAIGLTQMISSTATRFGKELGWPITRETLRDPVKNVAIGSRFLAFLWSIFKAHPGLVVPAYNAGEGAVWKWLCLRGGWPLDEFGEQVPYDQTRNYSKRVLNSFFVYSWLATGTVPVVSNVIPPEVINQKKCPAASAAPPEGAEKPDKTPPTTPAP